MNLYEQCAEIFRRYPQAAQKDTDSCARDFVILADSGALYHLTRPQRWRPGAYGLFPQGLAAGHGSFISRDGEFTQHGQIGRADFERIATATPVMP